jgi:hypothetical protein
MGEIVRFLRFEFYVVMFEIKVSYTEFLFMLLKHYFILINLLQML